MTLYIVASTDCPAPIPIFPPFKNTQIFLQISIHLLFLLSLSPVYCGKVTLFPVPGGGTGLH